MHWISVNIAPTEKIQRSYSDWNSVNFYWVWDFHWFKCNIFFLKFFKNYFSIFFINIFPIQIIKHFLWKAILDNQNQAHSSNIYWNETAENKTYKERVPAWLKLNRLNFRNSYRCIDEKLMKILAKHSLTPLKNVNWGAWLKLIYTRNLGLGYF